MTAKRNFPKHNLEDTLVVAQKLQDESGGHPMKRLLLADALGIKPASTNYRDLLSSSFKYGLTDGTEKATEISLSPRGASATQSNNALQRVQALRQAASEPDVFGNFYSRFSERKVPSADMMVKQLVAEFGVPEEHAQECAEMIVQNGRFVGTIRDIGGSPHILLDSEVGGAAQAVEGPHEEELPGDLSEQPEPSNGLEAMATTNGHMEPDPIPNVEPPKPPKAIFIGHGKKKGPVEKLQKFLTSFQIPHKVVVDEANLARPIPQKVKDTMLQCGSAILIFTRDEKFLDEGGQEVWRPSENVTYELGAASYAYEDRVVIFKEKGIHFPTNFQSIGYIEFEEDSIEAKTTELLRELVGFGLVKVTPAA